MNPVKRTPAKPKRIGATRVNVQASSGNVFADLGVRDPADAMVKAELAHEICALIKAAGMTQSQAARRLQIDQPKVSALMRGRLADFSTERLLRFLTMLDRDVLVVIRPAASNQGTFRLAKA